MTAYPYNIADAVLTWGAITPEGYGDDMVTVEFSEVGTIMTPGSRGQVVFTKSAVRSGRASITLLQGSPTNALLSLAAPQTGERRRKLVIAPFLLTDLNGTTLALGPEATLEGIPPITYKKNAEVRTWVFLIAEWTKIVNGGILPE